MQNGPAVDQRGLLNLGQITFRGCSLPTPAMRSGTITPSLFTVYDDAVVNAVIELVASTAYTIQMPHTLICMRMRRGGTVQGRALQLGTSSLGSAVRA